MRKKPTRVKQIYIFVLLAVLLVLGIWREVPGAFLHQVHASGHMSATPTTPIQHVVVIMMENHTFDNYFGQFPGANGVSLAPAPDPERGDFNHSEPASLAAMDGGKMDEFPDRSLVQYQPSDIPTYWSYAQNFALGDDFFTSMPTSSTPNHMAMVAAQTGGMADTPDQQGCRSPQNLMMYSQSDDTGPAYWSYPCYNIPSLPPILDAYGVSWRYYSDSVNIWNAPLMIQALHNSPNVINTTNQFVTDVQNGQLANVTWLVPPGTNVSDHPPATVEGAQNFVAQQINALMQSPFWGSTAVFVTWDDWGGFYDHVVPPRIGHVQLGLRVPLLVISPYARQGYISSQHNPLPGEFASFTKFIEKNWDLPNLGQRDTLPISDLTEYFNFGQTPLPTLIQPMRTRDPGMLKVSSTGKVRSAIFPIVGGPNTSFAYYVIWLGSFVPTAHNVLIDDKPFAMKKVGNAPGGGIYYKYTASALSVGSHTFSFAFYNHSTKYVLPVNNVPMSGPTVWPFQTSNTSIFPVSPQVALPSQPITYTLIYTSPTNTAPTLIDVDIDGQAYTMTTTCTSSCNYQAGVTYTYQTTLPPGVHYYRFRVSDSDPNNPADVAVYEGGGTPTITPIILSRPTVSPTSGTGSTVFTFQTTYTDAFGTPALNAILYIDNTTPYTMKYISGSYDTGAIYQVKTKLLSGTHSFMVVFSDYESSWANPFAPGVIAGPNVGASAQAVRPGTIIHDDNPNPMESQDGDYMDLG